MTVLNVTFGRFNYPHYGHKALINALGKDGVIIFSAGKKNIPVERRVEMTKLILQTKTLRYTIKPDMFSAFSDAVEFAKAKGYSGLNIIIGQDRASAVNEIASSLSQKTGFTIMTTPLNRETAELEGLVTSSSQMRQALDAQQKPAEISPELWAEMTICRKTWPSA